LPGSRERQRVVIRPLAGARGYRKVRSSKDVGIGRLILDRGGGAAEIPKDLGDVTVERSGDIEREVKLALAESDEGVIFLSVAAQRPETWILASHASCSCRLWRARHAVDRA